MSEKNIRETACPYCKKELNPQAIFCQFCGHNVATAALAAGLVLQERYRIVRPQGAGGMASVYLAEDLNLNNTQCVIKAMSDTFKDIDRRNYAINKFKEEAVILARLRHPSLPVVQNHFIEAGRYYLVMDYIEGNTMEELLQQAAGGFLSESEVLQWAVQVCEVLDYLHTHQPLIVHRDIKPSNLIRKPDGRIMLLDFGVAHIFEDRETATSVGTLGFAPPEQIAGCAYPQSDIFSLGATLHRLLTAYDPALNRGNIFEYPPLSQYRRDLSPGIQEIISRAMEMDYHVRFPSASHFRKALLMVQEKSDDLMAFLSAISGEASVDQEAVCAVPEGPGSLLTLYDEFRDYLVSFLGPVAEMVLDDCMAKRELSREHAAVRDLEAVLEMFCSKFNLTAEQLADISGKLKEIGTRESETPPAASSADIYQQLAAYLVTLLGPVAEIVLEDCARKLGFTRDTFSSDLLESVVEIFCSKFNLTSQQIEGISGKLQELRAHRKEAVPAVNIYDELHAFLVAQIGPVAEMVLDDAVARMGQNRSSIPPSAVESIAEVFYSKFKLTPEQSAGLMEKVRTLSSQSPAPVRSAEPERVLNPVEELKKYLIAVVGPVGESAFVSSITMLGYSESTLPLFAFDSLVEVFASKFTLTDDRMLDIRRKARELKSLGLSSGRMTTVAVPESSQGDTNITLNYLDRIRNR